MTSRQRFKHWLYGSCPGFAGRFPYHGVRVHFPRGSQIFTAACLQGVYEQQNLNVLLASLRPGELAIDIGANIGLMSVPVLARDSTVRVWSVEPSPNTRMCLEKTIAGSPYRDRWRSFGVATGDRTGEAEFFCATPALGVYDGLRDTHRGGATRRVTVPLKTVDRLWAENGRPPVCVVKIDVEGAEAATLRGAAGCLRTSRPVVLVEWNSRNLAAHGCPPGSLLPLAAELGYSVHSLPALSRMESPAQLAIQMEVAESFVLLPPEKN